MTFLLGCKNYFKDTSEGEITYTITYPNITDAKVNLMPTDMLMKFKDNKVLSEYQIMMGFFRIATLVDNKDKSFYQMARMINKKYIIKLSEKEIEDVNKEEVFELNITPTKETKEIAGFKCKKILVSCKNNPNMKFSAYYTEDIDIDDPNWCTPYKGINGVFLEYNARLNKIDMKFVANKIDFKKMDENEFKLPEDYKFVDIKTMKEFIPKID